MVLYFCGEGSVPGKVGGGGGGGEGVGIRKGRRPYTRRSGEEEGETTLYTKEWGGGRGDNPIHEGVGRRKGRRPYTRRSGEEEGETTLYTKEWGGGRGDDPIHEGVGRRKGRRPYTHVTYGSFRSMYSRTLNKIRKSAGK